MAEVDALGAPLEPSHLAPPAAGPAVPAPKWKKVALSAHIWGPPVVVVVQLVVSWAGARESAALHASHTKRIDDRLRIEGSLRNEVGVLRIEVGTWQAHVVALRERMIKAGISDLPPLPKPIEVRQDGERTEIISKEK